MAYTDLGLSIDRATMLDSAISQIRLLLGSDWSPSPAEQALLWSGAAFASEVLELAGKVPDDAIAPAIGEKIFRIPRLDATPASGTVTLHLVDAPDDVIPAGSTFDIDGEGFTNLEPIVITASATTAFADVQAVTPGLASSGLMGDTVVLASPSVVYVDSVTLNAVTTGGQDAETIEDYDDRLVEETPTLSAKAILIDDFAILARRNPAVGRSLALDNFDPANPLLISEGHVSVFVHDLIGGPLSGPVMADIADALENDRVLNIDVHVLAPTYTTIDVAFTVRVYPDWAPAAVTAAANAAVADFLSPATWGTPRTENSTVDWVDEPILLRNDLFGVLFNVDGVRHVEVLTIAVHGDSLSTSDIALAGPAALPVAGTISGAVAA